MPRRTCAMMQIDPYIDTRRVTPDIEQRVTARYRSKGNGSNSHPEAGLSWPSLPIPHHLQGYLGHERDNAPDVPRGVAFSGALGIGLP